MAKKFVPTQEQLEQILTRYKETSNYSLVSRETSLSVAIIKRIIQEAGETSQTTTSTEKPLPKPKTTAQLLAYKKRYNYIGPAPLESNLPSKPVYYNQIATMQKEILDV